ncbi:hypothetical protein H633G_11108, partial [Metarhizium anisopliae BRIP 53284]
MGYNFLPELPAGSTCAQCKTPSPSTLVKQYYTNNMEAGLFGWPSAAAEKHREFLASSDDPVLRPLYTSTNRVIL